jgi:RecA/RadA recombinase
MQKSSNIRASSIIELLKIEESAEFIPTGSIKLDELLGKKILFKNVKFFIVLS